MISTNTQSIVPYADENAVKYITLVPATVNSTGAHYIDSKLSYNPAGGVLSVNSIKLTDRPAITNWFPRVIQTYLDAPFTQAITAGVITDITGFVATIVPQSVNSRIFITVRWFGEIGSTNTWDSMWQLKRNGGLIGQPVSAGARFAGMTNTNPSYATGQDATSTPESANFYYIDSPNTTQPCTYQVSHVNANTITMYHNRTLADLDAASYERGTSTIILMEIL